MTGRFIRRKIKKTKKWILERPEKIRQWYVKKRVKSRNFTIISNNCWAGSVYRYFGMPYLSPTVGLYFFAEDYLKFVSDLHHYMDAKLVFIEPEESAYFHELKSKGQQNVPIGRLDDIEVIFLHYPSRQEAEEKWERRKARINWDNIFIKFSRMNLCSENQVARFCRLPFHNKFVFNLSKHPEFDGEYYWNGPQNDSELLADTRPFPGNVPMIKLLDQPAEKYPTEGLAGKSNGLKMRD